DHRQRRLDAVHRPEAVPVRRPGDQRQPPARRRRGHGHGDRAPVSPRRPQPRLAHRDPRRQRAAGVRVAADDGDHREAHPDLTASGGPMSTPNPMTAEAHVDESLVTYTHIIYALHALAVLVGITTAHTIVGSFVGGLPSIIAVIMNYVRRSATRGTYL